MSQVVATQSPDAPGAIDPAAVEAHFARSVYVAEVACVAWDAASRASRLVVVPDRATMRANGLAAVRELLRFEFETLAVQHVPPLAFPEVAVTFDPLPRLGNGDLDRALLASMRGEHLVLRHRTPLPASPGTRLVIEAIASQRAPGAATVEIDADTNLELDLGFDSLGRAALFADIELRMGLTPAATGIAWDDVITVGEAVTRVAGARVDGGLTGDSWRPTTARATPVAGDPVDIAPASPSGLAGDSERIWHVLLNDTGAADPVVDELARPKALRLLLLRVMLRLARVAVWPWLRIDVSGRSNLPADGPALLCPNHESFLDSFVLSVILPTRVLRRAFYLGASDYFATPTMAAVARSINLLPVDTDRNLARALRAGVAGLRLGKVLVVFPEGERTIDGTVRTFREGAARLARATGCPIVPIATRGMFALWPRGHGPQWRRLRPWRPARVRVVIGEPIAHVPGRSVEDTTRVLRDTVLSLWTSATENKA